MHFLTSHRLRKASLVVLQKLKASGELPDVALEYATRALSIDAPEEAEEEAEDVTFEEMARKVDELFGATSTQAAVVGILRSGALPELDLPARLDTGDCRPGDPGSN